MTCLVFLPRRVSFQAPAFMRAANDTIPACSSPLRAVGASVAHFGLSGDATLAAVSPFHSSELPHAG